MNSVDEKIRMAKHKERSVAQLLSQLESTLVSKKYLPNILSVFYWVQFELFEM